jgi:GTP-binding protein HflX
MRREPISGRGRSFQRGQSPSDGHGLREAAIELDRRKIRDRIAELRVQLTAIHKEQDNRRHARQDQLRVALVGYTNAGKSSLMRALSGSQVLVEDRLFATLDTTVRALEPETKPRILVSDTVGFIKNRLDGAAKAALAHRYAAWDATRLSAHDAKDVAALKAAIAAFFEASMVEQDLVIPYARQSLIGDVYESARVVAEQYDESGTRLRVPGLPAAIARLRRACQS